MTQRIDSWSWVDTAYSELLGRPTTYRPMPKRLEALLDHTREAAQANQFALAKKL